MNHWWVNHKQTHRQEIDGGYLWSPKRERDGRRSQYYEFMRSARPGDTVISFANAQVSYIGRVAGLPASAGKPQEFGRTGSNWADEGWLVPVEWTPIPSPFRPKDTIQQLQKFLPSKYSPLQENGNGNQKAYLTKVNEEVVSIVLEQGQLNSNWNDDQYDLVDFHQERADVEAKLVAEIETDLELPDTEKRTLIMSRRGQGQFRRNVESIEGHCRMSGITDARLLVASHIKPWRLCESAQERLNGNNGLLLAPHVDRLFDLGLISFQKDGAVLIASTVEPVSIQRLGLADAAAKGVGPFLEEQEEFLSFHREELFLG